MKRKTIITSVFLALMAVSAFAQQYNSESDFQIDWDKDSSGGVVITRYVGTRTEVSIPPRIQNNPVTAIGANAFRGNKNITRVIIPDGVVRINDGYNNQYSGRTIGGFDARGAFSNCTSLTRVTIPNSVTLIGNDAFADCTSLASITIPNSVTAIGGSTFYRCSNLASVTIPNSVTAIWEGAFFGCFKLTNITIPNSVTVIGYDSFNLCTSLTSVTIPNSVTAIGSGAFRGCSSLTSVTLPNSITNLPETIFFNCSKLASVNIPVGVTSIGDSAFSSTGITSVTIPNSVTSIGNSAFRNTELTSVTFQGTIPSNNFGTKSTSSYDYGSWNSPFSGDLRDKYLASDGGPGTYRRFAGGQEWRKQ